MASKSKDRDYLRVVNNDTPVAAATVAQASPVEEVSDDWSPPADFDDALRAKWVEILETARESLRPMHKPLLVQLTVAEVEYDAMRVKVRKIGSVLRSEGGHPYDSPFKNSMIQYGREALRLRKELGLTPVVERGNKGKGSKSPRKRGPFADLKTIADD